MYGAASTILLGGHGATRTDDLDYMFSFLDSCILAFRCSGVQVFLCLMTASCSECMEGHDTELHHGRQPTQRR